MPLQNRVDPFGNLQATNARGTLMGNRGGCLHDEQHRLTRSRWTNRRWIACLLDFRGRWRPVMQPHRYTELFFLDEATALAAGHRPCAQCRWRDFRRFKAAWLAGNRDSGPTAAGSIDAIDVCLHADRVNRRREKQTFEAPLGSLPAGVMVAQKGAPGEAQLVWDGALVPWSFQGYGVPHPTPAAALVTVLTPRSIVNAIAAGYSPAVHESLQRAEKATAPNGPI